MAAVWGAAAGGELAGAGGAGAGAEGQFPLEQWFYELPPCTRWWTAATVATSVLVQCQVLSPFQLFYSFRSVWLKAQYWRLLTTFVYFGPLNLDLIFHIFFLQRYSRLLEESAGSSPAIFAWLLLYSATALLLLSPLISIPFLGSALSSSLVYIWARRNADVRLNFLGLLVFPAPYLPWVLMGFTLLMHGAVPKDELCGVIVGHVWYFFADVWPPLHAGSWPLAPPAWWVGLFEGFGGVNDAGSTVRWLRQGLVRGLGLGRGPGRDINANANADAGGVLETRLALDARGEVQQQAG